MTLSVAAINPVDATFVLSILVLVAGVILAIAGLKAGSENENSQHIFAAVGVLFGLLAAGGIGTLFAQQTAHTTEKAAASAASEAAGQVSEELPQLVEESAEETQQGESSGKQKGGGKNP
jgi:thiol:disulfide interchange protein